MKRKKTQSYPAPVSSNNEQKLSKKAVNFQPLQEDNKGIEITNRYSPLANEEMEIPTEEHTEEISRVLNKPKGKVQTPVVRNKPKIPPIVIKGKLISQPTIANIRKAIKGKNSS
ncbi:hypothetical protein JTB14_002676 [Gonioctena quinquepunctata]|nr:hypothetical protein JTB14_002676 [Gonioctena quinquepunctata]